MVLLSANLVLASRCTHIGLSRPEQFFFMLYCIPTVSWPLIGQTVSMHLQTNCWLAITSHAFRHIFAYTITAQLWFHVQNFVTIKWWDENNTKFPLSMLSWWMMVWWKLIIIDTDVSPRTTVYPKKYAHGFCFAVLCCGYTLTNFPISIRLTSLALGQSNDCPSASKATPMNMDKYFMWIHYERLHNHNKAKHNKTVCIFLGIYCILPLFWLSSHCLWVSYFTYFLQENARNIWPSTWNVFATTTCRTRCVGTNPGNIWNAEWRGKCLTHWPPGDLDVIMNIQYSILFYCWLSSDLLMILPWDGCQETLLAISHHWFITWANVDPDLCHHTALLGHNELMFWGQ